MRAYFEKGVEFGTLESVKAVSELYPPGLLHHEINNSKINEKVAATP